MFGFECLTESNWQVRELKSSLTEVENVNRNSNEITQLLETTLKSDSVKNVELILEEISKLDPIEKLFLYLKLPTGKEITDPLKQPTNPLGSRPEISLTIAWIKTHLKEDRQTSLPKQEVYNEYIEYCASNCIKPLSTADFGKVMKQVYPKVRPRRLGTRGNSRYCYSGMTNRTKLPTPTLPKIRPNDGLPPTPGTSSSDDALATPSSSTEELTDDVGFVTSAKIFRSSSAQERRRSIESDKRKTEDGYFDVKKKKRTSADPITSWPALAPRPITPNVSAVPVQLSSTSNANASVNTSNKLPIPRLLMAGTKLIRSAETTCQSKSKQKQIFPKFDFLDNGNSTEQEEELLNYFTKNEEVSQLRSLLERKDDKTRRRVSFETSTSSQSQRFNFLPISPISNSPFLPPPTLSSSTPANEENSSASILDNDDNLNRILNIINEIETEKVRSYPNTPTYNCDPIVSALPALVNVSTSNSLVSSSVQVLKITDVVNPQPENPPPSDVVSPIESNETSAQVGLMFADDSTTMNLITQSIDCDDTFDRFALEVKGLVGADLI